MVFTMYNLESHPERHLRGMIDGELEVLTDDIPASLAEHVATTPTPADYETEYYDGVMVKARAPVNAEFDATMGIVGSVLTLSELPIPCMLQINTEQVEVDDGSLELELEYAGVYLVQAIEAKYEMKQWVVYAT